MNIIEGITGRNIISEIKAPPITVTRPSPDARTSRMQRYAQPQNNPQDGGLQLKVNSSNPRTRRGK